MELIFHNKNLPTLCMCQHRRAVFIEYCASFGTDDVLEVPCGVVTCRARVLYATRTHAVCLVANERVQVTGNYYLSEGIHMRT